MSPEPAQEPQRNPDQTVSQSTTYQKWSPSAVLSQHNSDGSRSHESTDSPSTQAASSTHSHSHSGDHSNATAPQRELPGRFFDADPEDLFTLIGTSPPLTQPTCLPSSCRTMMALRSILLTSRDSTRVRRRALALPPIYAVWPSTRPWTSRVC